MPRPPRLIHAGHCYHILNRANQKARIFHRESDYLHFVHLMGRAQEHVELPVLAVCLMPNHVHFVVMPIADRDVTTWMHWLFTTHSRHYNDRYEKVGHVWQGRFKASLAQTDRHLLTVMRYVERNPLRARLVDAAEDWKWGSLRWRMSPESSFELAPSPVTLPSWWCEFVNQPQTAVELAEIRASVNRQRPFGDPEWVAEMARDSQLEQTLKARGRPRKRRSGTAS
jgi:putative transposase